MSFKCLAVIGNICYSENSKEHDEMQELANRLLPNVLSKEEYASIVNCLNKQSPFSTAALKAIDHMMEKFSFENEYEFKDVTAEVEEAYNNHFDYELQSSDGIIFRAMYSFNFRGNNFSIGEDGIIRQTTKNGTCKRTHKAKAIRIINKIPLNELFPYIRDYADYMGLECNEERDAFGYWYNPYGVHECYIAKSWHFPVSVDCKDYIVPLKIRPNRFIDCNGTKYRLVTGARKKDIDFKVLELITPNAYSFSYILPSDNVAKRTGVNLYIDPTAGEVKSFIDKLDDNDIITVIDAD